MSNKIIKYQIKEEGITLTALVITIIIILILAGVTLRSVLGENGLIEKAQLTVNMYTKSEMDEEEKIKLLEEMMGENLNNTDEYGDIQNIDELRQQIEDLKEQIEEKDEMLSNYSDRNLIEILEEGTATINVTAQLIGTVTIKLERTYTEEDNAEIAITDVVNTGYIDFYRTNLVGNNPSFRVWNPAGGSAVTTFKINYMVFKRLNS